MINLDCKHTDSIVRKRIDIEKQHEATDERANRLFEVAKANGVNIECVRILECKICKARHAKVTMTEQAFLGMYSHVDEHVERMQATLIKAAKHGCTITIKELFEAVFPDVQFRPTLISKLFDIADSVDAIERTLDRPSLLGLVVFKKTGQVWKRWYKWAERRDQPDLTPLRSRLEAYRFWGAAIRRVTLRASWVPGTVSETAYDTADMVFDVNVNAEGYILPTSCKGTSKEGDEVPWTITITNDGGLRWSDDSEGKLMLFERELKAEIGVAFEREDDQGAREKYCIVGITDVDAPRP